MVRGSYFDGFSVVFVCAPHPFPSLSACFYFAEMLNSLRFYICGVSLGLQNTETMKKPSSYQRQKMEIAELKEKLRILTLEPESIEAKAIRIEIQTITELQNIIWFGRATQ
jgi:hypothetical protein